MDDIPDLIRAFGRALQQDESKSWAEIWQDVQLYVKENRRFPTHYFLRELFHRDVENPKDYLDTETVRRVDEARYRQPARWLFDDKYHFNLHLTRNDIRVPRLFGYSLGGYFYDPGRRVSIDTLERFRVLIFGLAGLAPYVFVKDLGGRMGARVFRITATTKNAEIEKAFEETKRTAMIYEEEQTQHPDTDAIYPDSFNTLRIINCMTGPDRVETVSALMRFGSGGSYVDNSSRGGLFVGVDLETGRLRSHARRFFDQGGGLFDKHPDTGFQFEGFQIPMFQEAIALAESAMRAIPSPIIGWDVGITPTGPVIVEGNAFADLFGAELAEGGYRHNEPFQRFLKSIEQGAWKK